MHTTSLLPRPRKKSPHTTKRKYKAFTLIEVLIVVAIIGMLSVIFIMAWRNHLNKGKDALRKKDLERLSVAFEEYYSDYGCYPDGDIISVCNATTLTPYLLNIPCDPVYDTPYCYLADTDNPTCPKSYRLLTTLINDSDPSIAELGCDGEQGCGYETECNAATNRNGYNFGLSSLNISVANPIMPSSTPTPTPSSTPTPTPGNYACTPAGNCDNFTGNPILDTCSPTFNTSTCEGYCSPTMLPTEMCPPQ